MLRGNLVIRVRAFSAVTAIVALALLGTMAGPAGKAAASEPETISSLVNQSRAQNGQQGLLRNGAMDQVALNWANQMAAAGAMSHNPSFSSQIPGGWTSAGENVAYGQPSGSAMHTAWMNSPGHRANILGDFTDIGIAFISAGGTTWGVEFFAKYAGNVRAAAPAPAPAPARVAAPAPAAAPTRAPAPAVAPVPAPAVATVAAPTVVTAATVAVASAVEAVSAVPAPVAGRAAESGADFPQLEDRVAFTAHHATLSRHSDPELVRAALSAGTPDNAPAGWFALALAVLVALAASGAFWRRRRPSRRMPGDPGPMTRS